MRQQIAFIGLGLLSIAVGLPLAGRRVPPNRWYGLRIPATFADEHVWYEANAATGRDLVALGCVLLVSALALPWFGLSPAAYTAACVTVLVAGSLVSTGRGWRLARRLLQERRQAGGTPRPSGPKTA